MPRLIFELVRDQRGSVVHVRHRQSGECMGCIEAGLFEIVAALVLEERGRERPQGGQRELSVGAAVLSPSVPVSARDGNDDGA